MQARQLLADISAAGMVVSLTQDNKLKVTPARALTDELRNSIRLHKSELVGFLQRQAANDPTPDADRWCWPHSTAMNGSEIETFTMRLMQFTDKGMPKVDAEILADKLIIRDREVDDRRVCLECAHLHDRWRCNSWQRACVGRDGLSLELTQTLQRCPGYLPLQPFP